MVKIMKKIQILKASEKTSKEMKVKFAKSENNKKIAEKCLELCEEWALVSCDSIDGMSIKESKKSCRLYVKENLAKDEAVKGIIITIILGIIVKLIVDWIVNNFIYNLKK
jgi:SOS response regulatory protein OraA/RecX